MAIKCLTQIWKQTIHHGFLFVHKLNALIILYKNKLMMQSYCSTFHLHSSLIIQRVLLSAQIQVYPYLS